MECFGCRYAIVQFSYGPKYTLCGEFLLLFLISREQQINISGGQLFVDPPWDSVHC